MDTPQIESCTKADVRYCLQYQPDRIAGYWFSFSKFRNGFKTERSALKALDEVAAKNTTPDLRVRIIKQTRTIEIKTTTDIEVLNDRTV